VCSSDLLRISIYIDPRAEDLSATGCLNSYAEPVAFEDEYLRNLTRFDCTFDESSLSDESFTGNDGTLRLFFSLPRTPYEQRISITERRFTFLLANRVPEGESGSMLPFAMLGEKVAVAVNPARRVNYPGIVIPGRLDPGTAPHLEIVLEPGKEVFGNLLPDDPSGGGRAVEWASDGSGDLTTSGTVVESQRGRLVNLGRESIWLLLGLVAGLVLPSLKSASD